jgi:N-acetylmuramoyl-L-alanine amidase
MARQIDFIVIHCTATPQTATVASIRNYWRNVLKWNSPGYHLLIDAAGTIHRLQPFDLPTNGVKGFNARSIHISYIGGQRRDDRTPAQKNAIEQAIREAQAYAKPHTPIIQGHRDFPNVAKACPQFHAKEEYQWMY